MDSPLSGNEDSYKTVDCEEGRREGSVEQNGKQNRVKNEDEVFRNIVTDISPSQVDDPNARVYLQVKRPGRNMNIPGRNREFCMGNKVGERRRTNSN